MRLSEVEVHFFTAVRMQLSALGSVDMQISERKTHAQLHNIQKFTSTFKKIINGQKYANHEFRSDISKGWKLLCDLPYDCRS